MKEKIENLYPLSPLQEGMLFHSLLNPTHDEYVNQLVFEIHSKKSLGPIDYDSLKLAWQSLVNQHDVFRTGFVCEEAKTFQFVLKEAELPWHEIDCSKMSYEEQELLLKITIAEELRLGINLKQPPLMRFTCLRLNDIKCYLIWTSHHILLDGWSQQLVLNCVLKNYQAYHKKEIPLIKSIKKYSEYIAWLKKQDSKKAELFWKDYLQDIEEVTRLPIAHNEDMHDLEAGYETLNFSLKEETTQKLIQFAQDRGTTINVLLNTAWAILLHRITQQKDIVFGVTLSGRPTEIEGIEEMIGLFINTVPIKVHFSPEISSLKLCSQIHQALAEISEYQYTPLSTIQRLSPLHPHTLFDSLIVFENYPTKELGEEEKLEQLNMDDIFSREFTNYPLTIAANLDTTLNLSLIYNSHFFEKEAIGRLYHARPQTEGFEPHLSPAFSRQLFSSTCESMPKKADEKNPRKSVAQNPQFVTAHGIAQTLAHILENIATCPEEPIWKMQYLSPEELRSIDEWNDTEVSYPTDKSPIQLFDELAQKWPDRIATGQEEQHLTYGELNYKANQLACFLKEKGITQGDVVAVGIERSTLLLAAMLAISKIGAIYLPIDKRQPTERIDFIVKDSNARLLLEKENALFEHFEGGNPQIPILLDSPAYIIYTSGTTGDPKGVTVSHKALLNLIHWYHSFFSLSEKDRASQFASPIFDAFIFETWPFLTCGASVHFVPEKARLSPSELIEWLSKESITFSFIPTAVCELLFRQNWDTIRSGQNLTSLRHVTTGGEALTKAVPEQFPCPFWNLYGPTENTVVTTCFSVQSNSAASVPIGKPIANVQAYILDASLQTLPVGIIGELYIGGSSLATSYQHLPALTSDAFIPNPFSKISGERLYRSGDLCRYLPDGNIEFIGRRDFQVKIRGFRIELQEIEAALQRLDQVRDVCVLVRENELVAYWTGEKVDTNYLYEHLQKLVLEYMIPKAFIYLEAFPYTAAGKIDRKALPTPKELGFASVYTPPRTKIERLLAQIWAEVLHLDKEISLHDNFFLLGGHSLLATQVISRIKTQAKLDIPLKLLFEKPKLLDFSHAIEQVRDTSKILKPPLHTYSREGKIPLSFAQTRLWFFEKLTPNTSLYTIPEAFSIKGHLQPLILEKALNEIVKRHEVLRTTFYECDGEPFQHIHKEAYYSLPIILETAIGEDKLTQSFESESHPLGVEHSQRVKNTPNGCDSGSKDCVNLSSPIAVSRIIPQTEAQAYIDEEAKRSFDLISGPLFYWQLFQLEKDKYIFIFNIHHIISDGWSQNNFFHELSELYNAFCEGRAGHLDPLKVQYADYSLWQREWLKDEVLEKQLAYWKEELSEIPELTNLPTDRPRPAIESNKGANFSFTISSDIAQKLAKFAETQEVTSFMLYLAAFQVLLHRYSNDNDIVVGTPSAHRQEEEVENLIGFFVNTLVLRARCQDNPRFIDFLQQIRETTLQAYVHQDVPFEQLVDHLKVERSLSHHPLFQIMFSFTNKGESSLNLREIETEVLDFEMPIAKFDLSFDLVESEEGLEANFEYATDLFDRQTIQNMAEHFQCLLKSILEKPELGIQNLAILTQAEREKILEWNKTSSVPLQEKTPIQLFEEQVQKEPLHTAIVFQDQKVTYEELNSRANQLAHLLYEKGISTGDTVGVGLERSPDLLIAMVAIAKIGAIFLPIECKQPIARIQFLLQNSNTKIFITNTDLNLETAIQDDKAMQGFGSESLPLGVEHSQRVKAISNGCDSDSKDYVDLSSSIAVSRLNVSCEKLAFSWFNKIDSTNLHIAVPLDTPAYSIYTSGTTGEPKGIVVQQKALLNLIQCYHDLFQITKEDKSLQYATPIFDAFIIETWPFLTRGAEIHIVDDEVRLSPDKLIEWMCKHTITFSFLTPSIANSMIQAKWPEHYRLNHFTIGGEQLTIYPAPGFPGKVWDGYGPTENTAITSCCLLYSPDKNDPVFSLPGHLPPIGKPFKTESAYIVDRNLQLVPIGIPGELCIGGAGLSLGYSNRPDLTAESFIPNPFALSQGARLYRTGDLCKYLPDGNIEYLGRIDFQVKIRGLRIELQEIESLLLKYQGVKKVVVLAREDQFHEKLLIAYWTGEKIEVHELYEHLQKMLPDYMIPQAFIYLEEFPLTQTGKIDRKVLPQPAELTRSREFAPPRTETERKLQEIWAQVLHLDKEKIGIYDNFFLLGGHSLLATQVISRIKTRLELDIPLKLLFEKPKLEDFAQAIDELKEKAQITKPPLQAYPHDDKTPLSFAQTRLWFFEKLNQNTSLYNIPEAYRFKGGVKPDMLEKALNEIVKRHEVLRTTFDEVEGQPFQHIRKEAYYSLPIIDLSTLEVNEREKKAQEYIDIEVQKPFDLTEGPLVRFTLLQMGKDDFILLLNTHHIISDGWSQNIFFQELSELYDAFCEGKAAHLASLPVQYADYAIWQRGWLKGDALEKQLAYWKEELSEIPELINLTSDRPRPPIESNKGSTFSFTISSAIHQKLTKLAEIHKVTAFMLYLAAFQVLLHRYTHDNDILVGTPIAHRQEEEIEKLIGFFVNTLVLRARCQDNPTFIHFLEQIRTTTLQAYVHQDVPFEQLVDHLRVERSLSHHPLFQVMFSYTKEETVFPLNLESVVLDFDMQQAKFDLSLDIDESEDSIEASFEYATDLFDLKTIQNMAEHFQILLQSIAQEPEVGIENLEILTKSEKEKILVEWNHTTTSYPQDKTVIKLFDEQVRKTPQNIAIVHAEQTLTYDELNKRANQVANALLQRSIGLGQSVAVGVERSPLVFIAMLAIFKIGAVYVPVDLSLPQKRLDFILNDSKAQILLTKEASTVFSNTLLLNNKIFENYDSSTPSFQGSLDDIAYMIYTSGTTGEPKGVLIQQKSLLNLVFWYHDFFKISQEDRSSQFASSFFDVFHVETWPLITKGASVHIIEEEVRTSAPLLVDWLQKHKVTIADFPVIMMKELLEVSFPDEMQLRALKTGGEKLPYYPKKPLPFDFWNMYGPSENTVEATCYLISKANSLEPHEREAPLIGKPLHNVEAYILDSYLQPVPIGVSGELYLGGQDLGVGYLGRPDTTAEVFIPHSFGKTGERLYRTGDLCKYLPDGNIEFLGRVDFQVKIRGFRIELQEIEAQLRKYPGISEALVLVRDDHQEKRLVAYWTGEKVEQKALYEHLQKILPSYMIPQAFMHLEKFPLTKTGKIDRKALPDTFEIPSEYKAPHTETERLVQEIWGQVLHSDKDTISMLANFFLLGGHSLLATQVISRIKTQMVLDIPLKLLFEKPKLEDFAQAIDELKEKAQITKPPLQAYPHDDKTPLSFAQTRLWFFEKLTPNTSLYNIPEAYRFKGSLKPDMLEKALNEIVKRHEVFRTTFDEVDGVPLQHIHKEAYYSLSVVDLSELTSDEGEKKAKELIDEEAQKPFDLTKGPLIRFKLLQLAPDDSILIVNMHHIISDEWSQNIFYEELSALYEAFYEGKIAPLSPLPIQYADYAIWQREWLKGEVLEKQLAYWKEELSEIPEIINLPTDRPRQPIESNKGATFTFTISSDMAKKLNKLAQEHNVTNFMLYLAAFQVLLHRYSHDNDILVGTPIAHRQEEEIEKVIGFFVNTLVIRARCQNNPSFIHFLAEVGKTTLQAYTHQDVPFEQLVDHLKVTRDLNHHPIFQVMFSFTNKAPFSLSLTGIETQDVDFELPIAKFDLSLAIVEKEDGLEANFEYATDLFDLETIQNMALHFQSLLQSIAQAPEVGIQNLTLLSEEEKEKILGWNRSISFSQEKTIVQLFEEQVENSPDNIAVVFEGRAVTYKELNQKANQLAHLLLDKGISLGDTVAVGLERSPDLLIAMVATAKIGAVFLPVDSKQPMARIQFILQNSDAKIFITCEDSTISHDKLVLNWIELNKFDTRNLSIEVATNSAAYTIYTSGTTGEPKGVVVQHKALLNLLQSYHDQFQITSKDKSLQYATPIFDAYIVETWPFLTRGAEIHIVEDEVRLSPEKLIQWMHQHEITFSLITTQLASLMMQKNWPHPCKLRHFTMGGEKLTQFPPSQFPTRLWNLYGPAENTVVTTCCLIHSPDKNDRVIFFQNHLPLIGRPFKTESAYILDPNLQLVPVGVSGELYIGGTGLSLGYSNRPDLTSESFIPNPFATSIGERLYKTGDLCRYLPDGNIEFLGRIDFQVKIRGFRIELQEIESILLRHPGVEKALVLAREDQFHEKQLIAYWVGEKIDTKDLYEHLKKKLPDYMIPQAFVFLESFPLTATGKIDRKGLPLPLAYGVCAEFVPPSSQTELKLAEIWGQVLHLEKEKISIHDNFFLLGGHSLLATQVISRIKTQLELDIPLKLLFEKPKLEDFAHAIDEMREKAKITKPALQAYPHDDKAPLSFAQTRLWFFEKLIPNSSLYNIPEAIYLKGSLKPEILEKALNEIVKRHEVLRTAFQEADGEPYQLIQKVSYYHLTLLDLSHFADFEKEIMTKKLLQDEAEKPFDIANGPLIRWQLLQLNSDEYILFINMHHIVSDGWSFNIFFNELSLLYNAFSQNLAPDLLPLPIQYADYAIWQRSWLQGETLEKELAYWKEELSEIPELINFPTDRPRPRVESNKGANFSFTIAPDIAHKIKKFASQEEVTDFMLYLAAFQVLLHRYSSDNDIIVGTPVAHRQDEELENLIGFFVNTLVLRARCEKNPPFKELLAQVRSTTLKAYQHQDLPFEQLVDYLNVARSLSHHPIFQVMFSFTNKTPPSLSLEGLQTDEWEFELANSKFDLSFTIEEGESSLEANFEYATDLFDVETIQNMALHFQCLLESIASHPEMNIGYLNLLPQQEKELLLSWNRKQVIYLSDKTAVQLFEEQVQKAPQNIAVVFDKQIITYEELNQKANQLARLLKEKKIACGDSVAVGLERSPLLLIAMIATQKIGATFVPIDMKQPIERINFLLKDSDAKVLILSQTAQAMCPIFILNQEELEKYDRTNLDTAVPLDTPSYMVYTSGTTGEPKGIVVQQKALLNLLHCYHDLFKISNSDKSAQFATPIFDAFIIETWPFLTSGGEVHIGDILACDSLIHWMNEHQITFTFITTAIASLLMKEKWPACTLRHFTMGGEKLTQYPPPDFPTRFWNLYGPTENTAITTSCLISSPYKEDSVFQLHDRLPPIGKPFPTEQAYILDRYFQPAPIGVPGELCLGGCGLSMGYLKRPDLTAESFIPNPSSQTMGERLYRTGDLCKYLPDGNIEFVGRIDFQVKIRGFRIELQEIEAALLKTQKVKEVLALAREDPSQQKQLILYWTGERVDTDELRKTLEKVLPEYMIPHAFIHLDSLPLTPTGKINRKLLPPPEEIQVQGKYVPATTEVEKTLVRIWQEVLHQKAIGIRDNYFALGGDSILSIKIISRCRLEGLALTVKDMFLHQTIEELALIVKEITPQKSEQELLTGDVPLTPIEHWFFDASFENPNHFNQSSSLSRAEGFNVELLKKAFTILLSHHDALRLRIRYENEKVYQYYSQGCEVALSEYDLSSLGEREQCEALTQHATQLQASLNLFEGPILRAGLFSFGNKRPSVLFIVIHHLAVDGVSWRILEEDLLAIYSQLCQNEAPKLPPKTSSYRSWAEHLISFADSEECKKDASYWLSLKDVEPVKLPLDRSEGKIYKMKDTVSISLSAEYTMSLLHEVSQAFHTQINDILLSALTLSFCKWSNSSSLWLHLEGHGREELFKDVDVSRTVGWFSSLFPVHLNLPSSNDLGDSIKSIKEQLRLIPRNGLSFGVLRYLSSDQNIKQSLASLPNPEVSFNYLGQFEKETEVEEDFGPSIAQENHSRHLIDINGEIENGKLSFDCTYLSDAFERRTIEELMNDFRKTLEMIIDYCKGRTSTSFTPSDFPKAGLSQDELDQLLKEI